MFNINNYFPYSKARWSLPLKITLMNWLFEVWTQEPFQECRNEFIIVKLNPLVISKNTANGFSVKKKINLIMIFEMTYEFYIQIIN